MNQSSLSWQVNRFVGERERSVEPCASVNRALQVKEALLLELSAQFGSESTGYWGFVGDQTPSCLLNALHDSVKVVRIDGL